MEKTNDNVIELKVNNEITGNNKEDLLEEIKENKLDYAKKGKYQIVTMTNEKWFMMTQKGRTFLSVPFANHLLSKYIIYCVDDKFYIYSKGYYKTINDSSINFLIEKELLKFKYEDIKDNWLKEVTSRIKNRTHYTIEQFNNEFNIEKNIINVKNGLIKFDFKTGEYNFLNHDKSLKSTIQLNVEYNKNNKNLNNWNKFLNTSLNTKEERMFLQEIMGYLLINHLNNNGQNFYCFHGEGGNGKGTLFRLFNEILSNKNVADCKSKMLTNTDKQNQFYGFQFINKLLIAISETNYDFEDLSLVKQLSGGDYQKVEKKGLNDTFDFEFKGKVIFSTNNKIKFRDTSTGVKRRVKFLVIDNKIKNTISNLDERLKEEKNSIFIWCLEGLKRLIKNDFKHTLPLSHFKVFEDYMEHSNNYLKFVRNHIVVGGEGIIKSEVIDLFNMQYGNIYKDKDKLYESFEKELKNEKINFEFKKTRTKSHLTNNPKVTMSYINIGFVEHKEEKTSNVSNEEIKTDKLEVYKQKILQELSFDNLKEISYYLNEYIGKKEEKVLQANRGIDYHKQIKTNEQKDIDKKFDILFDELNKYTGNDKTWLIEVLTDNMIYNSNNFLMNYEKNKLKYEDGFVLKSSILESVEVLEKLINKKDTLVGKTSI